MKQTVLALALMGMATGLAGAAQADLAKSLAAYEAGRCDEAVATLTPVAKAGDAAAQLALGDLYLDDDRACKGEVRETAKALPWYLLAAKSGNVAAQRRLLSLYDGVGKMDDPVQVTFWLTKVAALGGASDLSRLGTRYERAEGVPHDRVLAHAFNLLASRSEVTGKGEGKGMGGADAAELEKTLVRNAAEMSPEQVAEAERLAAAWKVGTALPTASTTGKRDPRDWYKQAAEAGDLAAAHKAGTLYWKFGYGLTAQPEQAALWLRKAAQGGITDAQYQLGQLYTMGYGVPKDYVLAFVLHRLAVKGGSKEALARKDGWDDALTDQQLDEGKALLARWKKGDPLPQASKYGMQRKVNYVEDATGKGTPTADVLALFKAANEGQEAQFTALLAKVKNIDDYLVEDEKLLHALLLPAASLRAEADEWRKARNDYRDIAHWKAQQARHAALLPAKTRMLAQALQRGARFDEGTQRHNAAPLHLAAMFGTPEMVKLLLKHGADPRQYGGQNKGTAPLEFALDQKEYGLGVPELITPQQRTGNLLALLQAGAARPYLRSDLAERRKKEGDDKLKRPIADYLLWPEVLAQTRGTAVLDALLKTGTRPADDDEGKTVFDHAAEAGNVEAIAWLKTRVPRYGKDKRDRWLDAAMVAMYSNAPERDKVLQQLLVKGMAWGQEGPQEEGYSRSHRTLFAGSERIVKGTLLEHATLNRRFEWIPKLAALGAPVSTGGTAEALAGAVRQNDIDGVKALLAQGADPLGGTDAPLTLALQATDGNDAILDLLLDHVVRVQKKSLAQMRRSPVEAVLEGPPGIRMARLRKLLAAGASLQDLGRVAIESAFAAPDRGLARFLIEHGLLRRPGAGAGKDAADKSGASADTNARPPGEPYFLFSAIETGRADLLPAILATPEDPNRRRKARDDAWGPSPVEFAISRGNTAVLSVLLAHGGVIDTTSNQYWGTALDRAVGSLNADMLRLVTKDFSLPLNQVCVKATGQLAIVLLDASPSYWELLRKHGFASGKACAGSQARLVKHLAETPGVLLEGWVGQRLAERLAQLGSGRETFDAALWAKVAASRNDALARVLASAGWTAPARAAVAPATAAPQRDKAADLALQATVPGHYYLQGVTEVGAEILLRPNGKFEYSMAYGAVDEYAKGEWTVWNKQVIFRSPPSQGKAASMRPSTEAPAATLPAGQLLVDLLYRGKSAEGFKVAALGDAPVKAEGQTGEQGWRTAFSGPVRHIAVSHSEIDRGKWMVYAVPAAAAQRGSFRLDFEPPTAGAEGFNQTLTVKEGSLVLDRDGRAMRFERQ